MYNWNQFRNIPKFKGMSAQEKARQYFLYQSNMMMEQSANAALAPAAAAAAAAGAGGGGRIPQPTAVDYGSEGVLYTGLYNDGVSRIWKGYFLNYNEETINEVDLEDANVWSDSAAIYTIQNGGYSYIVSHDTLPLLKIKFFDVSGNVLDSIEYAIDGPDRYLNQDNQSVGFGTVRKFKKFINNICVGYIWIWFNGKDKPTIHEFNGNENQDPKLISKNAYADRNGNFCIERNLEGNTYEYYSMGKKLVLIDTIQQNSDEHNMYYYASEPCKGATLLICNNIERVNRFIGISGNQEICEYLEIPVNTYTYTFYPYGTFNKGLFKLVNENNTNLFTYLSYVEKSNKFAVIDIDTTSLTVSSDFQGFNPWDASEPGLVDSCFVYTFSNESPYNVWTGSFYSDFTLYYLAGDDDQWRTFQRSNIFIASYTTPRTSGNGIYIITHLDGTDSAYSLYLSKGTETYSEIVPWATQGNSQISAYRTGINSMLYLCTSPDYSNYLQAKIVTAGKSADGGDNPILYKNNNAVKSFGITLCNADGPLFNQGIAYAWTEGTGKWHKFESPQAIYPFSEPYATNDGVNVRYFGCKFPQAELAEDSHNGNPGGRFIIINGLSSTLSYIVGPWSWTPEKNTQGNLYGTKLMLYGYYAPNQYFVESVDVDSMKSYEYLLQPAGSTWHADVPAIVGKRGFFKYNAESVPHTFIKLVLLGRTKAVESDLIEVGDGTFTPSGTYVNDNGNSL